MLHIILHSSSSFSRQLCLCLEHIVKHDFPDNWNGIVPQIHSHLSSDIQGTWLGSLLALYQLSKKYKSVDRCHHMLLAFQPMHIYVHVQHQQDGTHEYCECNEQ